MSESVRYLSATSFNTSSSLNQSIMLKRAKFCVKVREEISYPSFFTQMKPRNTLSETVTRHSANMGLGKPEENDRGHQGRRMCSVPYQRIRYMDHSHSLTRSLWAPHTLKYRCVSFFFQQISVMFHVHRQITSSEKVFDMAMK